MRQTTLTIALALAGLASCDRPTRDPSGAPELAAGAEAQPETASETTPDTEAQGAVHAESSPVPLPRSEPLPDTSSSSLDLGLCAPGANGARALPLSIAAAIAPEHRMGPYAVSIEDRAALVWIDDATRDARLVELRAGDPDEPIALGMGTPEGGLSSLRVASGRRCVGLTAVRWTTETQRAVLFTRWCGGEVPDPIVVAPVLGENVAIAPGPGGRFGVAWLESNGLSDNHLGFASIAPDGVTIEASGRILESVFYESISLVATETGWLLVGAASSLGGRGALHAVRIDADGDLVDHGELVRGDVRTTIGAPVLARHGSDVMVAFSLDQDLAMLEIGEDGVVRGAPRVLLAWSGPGRDDIGSSILPDAVLFRDDAWWIAFERRRGTDRFQAGALTSDGVHASRPIEVGGSGRGSLAISLAPTENGMLAAIYEDPWSTHDRVRAFALCGSPRRTTALAEASLVPASAPCEPRSLGMPMGRYGPAREVFALTAMPDGDLAVGYSTLAPDTRNLARMGRDGVVRWTRALEASRGMPPAVAANDGAIAAAWGATDGLHFAVFGHDGAPRVAPRRIGEASGHACVAPLADGWAVVGAEIEGATYYRLAADGSLVGSRTAAGAMECALSPAEGGVLLAMSRPGDRSETNFLYVQRLAPDGAPIGDEREIERLFARSPVLLRTSDGHALAWADPLTVDDGEAFRFVRLDLDGAPIGAPTPHGWNRGTGGWGIVPGETEPLLLHASRTDWIEQPLCADHPRHPPPRMPREGSRLSHH